MAAAVSTDSAAAAAAVNTTATPVSFIPEAALSAAKKAGMDMLQAFMQRGTKTYQALAESRVQPLQASLERKKTDQNVQIVYSRVFHATMVAIDKLPTDPTSIEEGSALALFTAFKLKTGKETPDPMKSQVRQQINAAQVMKNLKEMLEETAKAGPDLVKKFVASYVIPQAIALAERIAKEEPTAFANAPMWQETDANIEKYKAYNIDK